MEADLINAYIEELNNEVAALMKAKIALAARLRVTEQERNAALEENANLKLVNEELAAASSKKKVKTEE